MATPLIGAKMKQIEKLHGGYLNHWVVGLMHITVQTCCDLNYLTMRLSGYMNAPALSACNDLKMSWNISCIIHMIPSCTQERKFMELTSKQEMHKSAKLRNNPTSFTHIMMQIMLGISLTDAQSLHQFISSMVPSLTVVPRNSLKPP